MKKENKNKSKPPVKYPLYVKFTTGYLLFILISFILIATASSRLTYDYLLSHEASTLYRKANYVTYTYLMNSADFQNSEDVLQQLKIYAKGAGVEIWITNKSGKIQLSTAWGQIEEGKETEFNPLDFGSLRYQTGTFYHMFDTETLSVYATYAVNFQTQGYVLIHEPTSEILKARDAALNITYLTVIIVSLLSFIILIVFHFTVYRPVKKITRAANEYASGNLTYQITNIHSHDEMGYLAATLNYMAQRLNQTGEDQKKFVANVSHDFRSPLTSIKGYIEAIQDGTIPPELQGKYLDIVLSETSRLTKLTQNMLTLNTFDTKGNYLDYTDFDINHTIKKIIASFEGTCLQKGITFDLTFSSEELKIHADQGKIEQVLYNLIDNAQKFSHHDGTIAISTKGYHGKAFISVKDSGIGIAKENINKIWDRFYKIDSSRGKDKKGTGLGLSIVKEIIQAHHGTIDVISTEGIGTEFIIQLMLAPEQEAGSPV